VARIQWQAVRVLEKKDEAYVRRYFTSPEPAREIDRREWHEKVAELRERKKSKKEGGVSLRIGRIITLPGRLLMNAVRKR
jgi:hypothetical protein